MKNLLSILLTFCFVNTAIGQNNFVKENYTKYEFKVPMRDGVKLHTNVYVPKDASEINKYPFMMQRTCYSVAPYGVDKYPSRLGPSEFLMKDKYIFVYQDVRGRWMSEGKWTNMTPNNPGNGVGVPVDESSDTYDTIEWLLNNVPNNNGKFGQWGISYPGFYTIAGAVDAHPALKASSPQAPVSDFFFDDFHHNGAFIQAYLFTYPVFGIQHNGPTPNSWYDYQMIDTKTKDGYQFQLDLGPLKNVQQYYKDNFYWQETVEHPNYDEFWQKRSIIPHLKNVNHAVMTVGGWFDAEDLYGPLAIYKTLEKNNSKTNNTLVMGPFGHGRWSVETGHTLHSNVYFGDSIATFYQKEIEKTFFNHYLKGAGDGKTGLPEAYLFDTGKKDWRKFDTYPYPAALKQTFFLNPNGKLDAAKPTKITFSEFVSDPAKPVPYSEDIPSMLGFTPFNYMSEDQRFAAKRPDVLVFQSDILTEDVTVTGDILAKLKVSTTGTDADWVVKLVDVYPGNEPNHPYMPDKKMIMANYHQMVRSEVMRGRFRNSFEKPQPFIFKADDKDFIKATHRVFSDSSIEINVLK
ncbi:MAG: CocE/NonD family hydrolase [Spirosomaceae bacterium]|nr:CocE/NonD family hydrolase [Spirosomataceae bacterium]